MQRPDLHKPKHWRLARDHDGIAWLDADRAGSSINSLSAEMLDELAAIIKALATDRPRGLVIRSAKRSGFIAGADIREFTILQTTEAAANLICRAQSTFDLLEALDLPTVALIHGYCLGGGLELALACRYRVVVDAAATSLGMPEVKLGIHPCFGGTVRLTGLIGAPVALRLMLSGDPVGAQDAHRLGVVDHAVPEDRLEFTARELVLHPPPRHRPGYLAQLAGHRLLRPLLAHSLKQEAVKHSPPDHYPAPYALIDLWRRHADHPRTMLAEEAWSASKLITGYASRNLVRTFFLQERLKGLGKKAPGPAVKFGHVHLIGNGSRGAEIAAWCAMQGLAVTVQDSSPTRTNDLFIRARNLVTENLEDRRQLQQAMERLQADRAGDGVSHADVIFESSLDKLEARQELLRDLERRVEPRVLLATGAVGPTLDDLARSLDKPARLVGLHFFSPVPETQLVEVAHGNGADGTALRLALAFTRRIRRLPLPVRNGPGLLVHRVLMPYLLEAMRLAEQGVPLAAIDKAALDFGMATGPFEFIDTMGLDTCLSLIQALAGTLGCKAPQALRELIKAGRRGRKSGQGFYVYRQGRPQNPARSLNTPAPADLADRLVLPMLNEAVRCLREGVVANEELLDAGMIVGGGFGPFHGGPLHYLRYKGADNLRNRLRLPGNRPGEKFQPDPGWQTLGRGG